MLSFLNQAGWPIWPLLATSVLGLALIFERALALRTRLIIPRGLTEQAAAMVRSRQNTADSLKILAQNSPLGRVLADVILYRDQPYEALRNIVEDTGRAVGHELNRYIPALGTIAMVAPLMGLFGTVIGMIDIFSAYTPDGSDPTQLAHGISIALYSTGFGIIIAIPAMIAHRYFRSRIDHYLHSMEQSALRLTRLIDTQQPKPAPNRASSSVRNASSNHELSPPPKSTRRSGH